MNALKVLLTVALATAGSSSALALDKSGFENLELKYEALVNYEADLRVLTQIMPLMVGRDFTCSDFTKTVTSPSNIITYHIRDWEMAIKKTSYPVKGIFKWEPYEKPSQYYRIEKANYPWTGAIYFIYSDVATAEGGVVRSVKGVQTMWKNITPSAQSNEHFDLDFYVDLDETNLYRKWTESSPAGVARIPALGYDPAGGLISDLFFSTSVAYEAAKTTHFILCR